MSNEMNEREILSAYFDGELMPEERQRAEQVLEDSVAARREIDEIAELSELVKSLPTESAPVELLPAVLREAELETLLPTQAASVKVDKPKSQTWLTVIAGLAAAAAAVVLTIQYLPNPESNRPEAIVADPTPYNAVASIDPAVEEQLKPADARNAAGEFDQRDSDRTVEFEGNGVEASKTAPTNSLGVPMESPEGLRGGVARRSAGAPKRDGLPIRDAEPSGFGGGGNGTAPSVTASEALSINADSLKFAQRGDEFHYFSANGTTVTTYLVTVVDVQQALDKMQVLLTRHQIPTRTNDEKTKERNKKAKPAEGKSVAGLKGLTSDDEAESEQPKRQAGRMIAVYVETTPDRFTSVLKDLLRDKMLADLHPKPPVDETQIEVADLRRSRRQLFSRVAVAGSSEKKFDAANGQADAKPAAPADASVPSSPQTLLRKSKQVAESKPPTVDAKDATKNIPAKPGQKAEAKEDGKPAAKKQYRDEADKRFVDGERAAAASFQLQVQLAPRPQPMAERQKAPQRRANLAAGKPHNSTPSVPQKNARSIRHPQLAGGVGGSVPPTVRVLFVFREMPKKSDPQP